MKYRMHWLRGEVLFFVFVCFLFVLFSNFNFRSPDDVNILHCNSTLYSSSHQRLDEVRKSMER